LIEVEYELLPAVFDPLEAIKEEAPQVHEGVELNINVTRHIEWGDVDEAFTRCDYIREDHFKCSSQPMSAWRPRCCSQFRLQRKLTVWTSLSCILHASLLAPCSV